MSSRDQKLSVLRSLLDRVQRRASAPRVTAAEPVHATPAPAPAAARPPTAPPPPAEPDLLDELGLSASPPAPPAAAMPAAPPTSGTMQVAAPVASDELEIVEELQPEPVAAAAVGGATTTDLLDESDLLEEAPAELEPVEEARAPISSRRPRAPETTDDALADIAVDVVEEREVPIKTPPPESGRQQVAPVDIPPSPVPAVADASSDDLELAIPVSAAPAAPPPRAAMPSIEQLGGTIDLAGDESDVALELAPPKPLPVQRPSGEMEAVLPPGVGGGTYTPELAPPPEAAEDLARHDLIVGRPASRIEHTEPGPPVALRPPTEPPLAPPAALATPPVAPRPEPESAVIEATPAPPPPAVAPAASSAPAAEVRLVVAPAPAAAPVPAVSPAPAPIAVEVAASITHRTVPTGAEIVSIAGEAKRFAPTTFGELLDASLSLGR